MRRPPCSGVEARGCTFTVLGTAVRHLGLRRRSRRVWLALLEGSLRFESADKHGGDGAGLTWSPTTAWTMRPCVAEAGPTRGQFRGMDRRRDPLRRDYVAGRCFGGWPASTTWKIELCARRRFDDGQDVPHLAHRRRRTSTRSWAALCDILPISVVRRLPLCGGRPAAVMPPLRSRTET